MIDCPVLTWCLAHRLCLVVVADGCVRKLAKEQIKAWIDERVRPAVAGKVRINLYF